MLVSSEGKGQLLMRLRAVLRVTTVVPDSKDDDEEEEEACRRGAWDTRKLLRLLPLQLLL